MNKYIAFTLTAIMIAGVSMPAIAQTDGSATPPASTATNNSGEPIEITASKSVEWLRNDKQYVARENVIITQGTMKITSDLATADYKETKQSSMQIWQLTATGDVDIISDTNTAHGDKAIYNVETGVATLTGEKLTITSPDQTVTATEKMEYYANTRQAKAIGNAKVLRGKDTLSADTITATFKDKGAAAPAAKSGTSSPMGGNNLDRLEADGNVVIVTPTETLRGSKGIYRADTNTAELTGKVKIERGKNILEGNRAEVNLTTNVSKMFGTDTPNGRVRGVFFPGSEKKPEPKTEDKGRDKDPDPSVKPSKTPAPAAKTETPIPAPSSPAIVPAKEAKPE